MDMDGITEHETLEERYEVAVTWTDGVFDHEEYELRAAAEFDYERLKDSPLVKTIELLYVMTVDGEDEAFLLDRTERGWQAEAFDALWYFMQSQGKTDEWQDYYDAYQG